MRLDKSTDILGKVELGQLITGKVFNILGSLLKWKINLIQKQPSCKKKCAALKKAIVKKDVKSKVAAKNGCDGRLIAMGAQILPAKKLEK